jgi:peptide/nickel transport system substrate-binding protein
VAAVSVAFLYMGNDDSSATAKASVDKTIAKTGETILFTGAGSEATGTNIEYQWFFGDGSNLTTNQVSVSHVYTIPGKYVAILKITDSDDNTDTTWEEPLAIEVTKPTEGVPTASTCNGTLPYAIVAANETTMVSSTSVSFNGDGCAAWSWELSGGRYRELLNMKYVNNLTWDFGDGSAAVVTTPILVDGLATGNVQNHTYTGDGVLYTMKIAVRSTHSEASVAYFAWTIVVFPKDFNPKAGITNPDTITSVTIGDPRSIDPAFDYENAGGEILQNVYETLVFYDGNSTDKFVPQLCTEIPTVGNGISDDGKNYTFKIRQNVKFHDGNIMTPEDVAFSMQRVLVMNHYAGPAWIIGQVLIADYWSYDGDTPIPMDMINNSVTYNNTAWTVTFHLIQPYPAFIACLAYTVASVVEKSFVQANSVDANWQRNTFMDRNEMGTGPYTLIDWVPKQYIRMDAFSQYWKTPASIKHVLIKQIPTLATREMLLLKGQADFAYIDPQYRTDVRGYDDILDIVEGKPSFTIEFIGFTQAISVNPDIDIGDIPDDFFADPHVRMAFCYAFNYEKNINDIWQGTAIQPNSVIPKGMFGYNATVPMYDYNETAVKEQLGLALDTRTADPTDTYLDNGFEIFLYYNSGNIARRDACLMMKGALQNASSAIKVNVVEMEWTAFLDANDAGELPMMYLGWAPDYADPDDYAQPFLLSTGLYGRSLGLYNATIDELIMEASMELNTTLRAELYYQINVLTYENAWFIWTNQATNFHVERNWINGWFYNPMFSGGMYYNYQKG